MPDEVRVRKELRLRSCQPRQHGRGRDPENDLQVADHLIKFRAKLQEQPG